MTNCTVHETNMKNIALADLRLQKDAMQKTLTLLHRTMIIALVATTISFFATLGATIITIASK